MLAMVMILSEILAGCGILYTAAAMLMAGRWQPGTVSAPDDAPPVTILKPLYGREPALEANLRSFLDQDYPAPIQMVCGVASASDDAIPAEQAIEQCELVIDDRRHGANGKISNLINIAPSARHDLIVISDSDIAVDRDYLARIAAAMAAPGTGAVTCLYAGRGDAGFWSRITAAGISYQFLPGVIMGLALGLARPCMGSTIALHQATLDRIGGFARFADILADDHAIGAAVRDLGLAVAVPPMIVTHGNCETSLAGLVRHELRWNATIRRLDPLGFAGSIITHPLPFAILAALLGGTAVAVDLMFLAFIARSALALRIDRLAGRCTAPLWLLPFRDVLSMMLFVASFFVRSVDWRDAHLALENGGRISARAES